MARVPQTVFADFSGGEISPLWEGRVDIGLYYKSCRVLENFIVLKNGGVTRRPGSLHSAFGKTDADTVRLIPFLKSLTESYVLELGDQYIRVYDNGSSPGRIEDPPGTAVEVTGSPPWTKDQIFDVQFCMYKKEMYLVHASHAPRKLVSTSSTVWTLSTPAFVDVAVPIFNAAGDYPSVIWAHEQSLILAGTNNDPDKVWKSHTGTPLQFAKTGSTCGGGSDPCNGLEYRIDSQLSARFRWLVGKSNLLFGLDSGEGVITGDGAPLTGTTARAYVDTEHGSELIQAVKAGEAVIFVQAGGQTLRQFHFRQEFESMVAPDLTYYAEHVTGTGVVQMALQQNPHLILWCVTADGNLVALTYERHNQVIGWHRHPTGAGLVESAAAGRRSGGEDRVWLSVARTINGTTRRHIEYLDSYKYSSSTAAAEKIKDAHFVDSGIVWSGGAPKTVTGATNASPIVVTATAHGFVADETVKITGVSGMTELNGQVFTVKNPTANTFELYNPVDGTPMDGALYGVYTSGGQAEKVAKAVSGLTHLEGQTVKVLGDGSPFGDEVVSAGAVTIDYYANKIHVGLAETSKAKLMRLTYKGAIGKSVAIHELLARVYETVGLKWGPDESHLDEVPFNWDKYDEPTPLFSGDVEESFPGEDSSSGDLMFVQDQPLPATVLLVSAEVTLAEV